MIVRQSARILGVEIDDEGARRSPRAAGERRGSRTGSCGASETTRKSKRTAASPARWPWMR